MKPFHLRILKGNYFVNVGVVIAAAGQGKRMRRGFNKQFIPLGDRPLIAHTLAAFERMSAVGEIVVVTRRVDIPRAEAIRRAFQWKKVKHIVVGGETRQESVRLGLKYLNTEWVLVHDGARPFVKETMVRKLLDEAKTYGAAVPGVPVKDTIKQVDGNGIIEKTPDRARMWAVQTPQVFRLSELREAHERARRENLTVTDDAMLMEHLGVGVKTVRGDYFNLKVTTPEDLLFAEAILQHKTSVGGFAADENRTRF